MMLCIALLAVVFATAGLGKLRDREAIAHFTSGLPQFGLPARRSIALAVAVAELATVALLFLAPRAGGAIGAVLLAGFTVGVAHALRRGVRAECRCFGVTSRRLGPEHVVRNALLIGAAALIAVLSPTVAIGGVDIALAIVGALLGLLVTRLDDVLFIFQGGIDGDRVHLPRRARRGPAADAAAHAGARDTRA